MNQRRDDCLVQKQRHLEGPSCLLRILELRISFKHKAASAVICFVWEFIEGNSEHYIQQQCKFHHVLADLASSAQTLKPITAYVFSSERHKDACEMLFYYFVLQCAAHCEGTIK